MPRRWSGRNPFRTFLLLLSLIGAPSCEDLIQIPYPHTRPQLVVDARIEQNQPLVLILTQTQPYNATNPTTPLTQATVKLHNLSQPQTETIPHTQAGKYLGHHIVGQAGHVYQIQITHQGTTYTATDTLRPVPPIQSARIAFVRPTDANRSILIHFTDPPRPNYYRWLITVDNYTLYQPHDLLLATDRTFNNHTLTDFVIYDGRYLQRMRPQAQVQIQQISLSHTAYQFYYQLYQQSGANPNPWAQPAYNLPGNLTHGALGLFRATATTSYPTLTVQ